MNEIIKLAVEQGEYMNLKKHSLKFEKLIDPPTEEEIVLDPLFWQALGKALGWSGFKFYFEGKWQYTDDPTIQVQSRTPFVYETWLANALDYHKLLLTGGDTEKFWEDLLSEKLGNKVL